MPRKRKPYSPNLSYTPDGIGFEIFNAGWEPYNIIGFTSVFTPLSEPLDLVIDVLQIGDEISQFVCYNTAAGFESFKPENPEEYITYAGKFYEPRDDGDPREMALFRWAPFETELDDKGFMNGIMRSVFICWTVHMEDRVRRRHGYENVRRANLIYAIKSNAGRVIVVDEVHRREI